MGTAVDITAATTAVPLKILTTSNTDRRWDFAYPWAVKSWNFRPTVAWLQPVHSPEKIFLAFPLSKTWEGAGQGKRDGKVVVCCVLCASLPESGAGGGGRTVDLLANQITTTCGSLLAPGARLSRSRPCAAVFRAGGAKRTKRTIGPVAMMAHGRDSVCRHVVLALLLLLGLPVCQPFASPTNVNLRLRSCTATGRPPNHTAGVPSLPATPDNSGDSGVIAGSNQLEGWKRNTVGTAADAPTRSNVMGRRRPGDGSNGGDPAAAAAGNTEPASFSPHHRGDAYGGSADHATAWRVEAAATTAELLVSFKVRYCKVTTVSCHTAVEFVVYPTLCYAFGFANMYRYTCDTILETSPLAITKVLSCACRISFS